MNLAYVIDTDWIIDHFNGIEPVTRRLAELQPAGLAMSIISLAELAEGVHYSRDPARSRAILARFVGGVAVLPIDDEICDVFGREPISKWRRLFEHNVRSWRRHVAAIRRSKSPILRLSCRTLPRGGSPDRELYVTS